MKSLFIWILLFPFPALAEWSRVSEDTIKFVGKIEEGEVDRYKAVASAKDSILIVDSDGGDVEAGVRLGMELVSKKLTIIVDGLCASSCANYVFTAGAKKEVKRGFVGYHGNITSFLANDWEKIASALRNEGTVSEQQILNLRHRFDVSAKIEQDFLKLTGVSQKLFDKTQLRDKGNGKGRNYNFLIPKVESFAQYGITNVAGTQDPKFNKDLGLENLYE